MLDNINNLSTLIDEYTETKGFIDRALEQRETFPEAVIQKVINELNGKSGEITTQIEPLISDAQYFLGETQEKINDVESSKSIEEVKLQELELKKAIGLMTDAEFEDQSTNLRNALDDITNELNVLTQDKEDVESILNRWQEVSGITIDTKPTVPEVQPVIEEDEIIELDQEDMLLEDSEESPSSNDEADDQQAKATIVDLDVMPNSQSDNISPFDTYEASQFDAEEIDFAMGENDFDADEFDALGSEIDDNEFDLMGDQLDLDDDLEGVSGELPELPSLDGPELTFDNEPNDDVAELEKASASEDESGTRTAILIRDAGTANEVTFPFNGDKYTIGRSQDNDIVIKGDSKVSRHHCKLFRRSSQFYIEDQHSSNGTVVNSELINERRLFGGEEIKVGETTFIFRIQ